jgi:hypothetical protein
MRKRKNADTFERGEFQSRRRARAWSVSLNFEFIHVQMMRARRLIWANVYK